MTDPEGRPADITSPITDGALANRVPVVDARAAGRTGYDKPTADNSIVLLVDHQVGLMTGMRDTTSLAELRSNIVGLARTAKALGIPTLITSSNAQWQNGDNLPELKALFPDQPIYRRTGIINCYEDPTFRAAIEELAERTGRRHVMIAAVTIGTCCALPTLSMLNDGYAVYPVVDACGAWNRYEADAAMSRMARAGAELVTTFALACELQADWKRPSAEAMLEPFIQNLPEYGFLIQNFWNNANKHTVSDPFVRSKIQVGTRHGPGLRTHPPVGLPTRPRSGLCPTENLTIVQTLQKDEATMPTVGLVGVGDMGSAVLPHLLGAGYAVAAFDTDVSRLDAAVAAGAQRTTSPAGAAGKADIVLSLVMSEHVLQAHLGARGILAGLRPGAALIIGSTTTPDLVREVGRNAVEGASLVDAPMIGGVRYAQERRLTFLAGGHKDAVAKAHPILSILGCVEHVGSFGSGVAYKLITNALVMAAEVGLREALDLTDMLGGDYRTALKLFELGPMSALVTRALDELNPRPLRAAAEDFDTLLSAVKEPTMLPLLSAGRNRLWEAVDGDPSFEPMFIDLTRSSTTRVGFRAAGS